MPWRGHTCVLGTTGISRQASRCGCWGTSALGAILDRDLEVSGSRGQHGLCPHEASSLRAWGRRTGSRTPSMSPLETSRPLRRWWHVTHTQRRATRCPQSPSHRDTCRLRQPCLCHTWAGTPRPKEVQGPRCPSGRLVLAASGERGGQG